MPIASIDGGDLSKVWEIKTLGLARDAEARKLLEDVAKQVQPIMRKRKWKVQLLCEFCPQNPSLLGLNIDGGREIRIRLRRHPSDPQLFAFEETLGTMLHELTHIQCGPHNAVFYKLLDELKVECEELMIKGIKGTGQGFDARGHRLGGFRRNPPPTSLRQVALAAAEKRARAGVTMPSGPRRLGGDSEIMNALSPLQAAAMAAERRLRDDVWCAAPETAGEDGLDKAREREGPSGSKQNPGKSGIYPATKENQGRRENAENSDVAGRGSSRTVGNGSASNRFAGAATNGGGRGIEGSESNPVVIGDGNGRTGQEELTWDCHVCTLSNTSLSMACMACETPRLQLVKENSKTWICKFCTLKNDELLTNCGACDQWRFSYGAPISSRGPYVGT